ncbi:GNAT family N-acetyltransferase [Chitinibacteraceae bacterium HSL-7]
MNQITCRAATAADLPGLASLFDLYRQFYRRESDLAGAQHFLAERLTRNDSIILVAELDGTLSGFAQAYPSLSSLALEPVWILNDLFVVPGARKARVGTQLLQAIEVAARAAGAAQVRVETSPDNLPAQRLYQSQGFAREMGFLQFVMKL